MFEKILINLYREELNQSDIEKVKNLVSDFYKVSREVLDKVKISYSNLPTFYACVIRKIGDYVQVLYRPIAKILGVYNPKTKEVYIDKKIPYNLKVKTLIHEYVHAIQDYLGKLYTNSKRELEKEAHKVSDYLFKIYNQASQKFASFLNYPTLV